MSTQKIKLGVDWAWGRIRARRLRAAGYTLAARYLSHDKTKNLTRIEATALLKAGEDIVVVWESTAGRATQGQFAGVDDAREAVRQLRTLRGPKGMAIYFAVDKDVAGSEVAAYFRGARRIVHAAGYRIGAYGSYRVVQYLKSTVHVVDVAWQTVAWSFGKLSKLADLYQRAGYKKVDGVTVDVDVVCHPDYGGWQGALAKPTAAHVRKKRTVPPVAKRRRVPKISTPTFTVTRAWLVDTFERALSTFVEYFAGTFGMQGLVAIAGGHWQDALSLAHTASAAAAAAGLAVVKAAFAAKRKGTISPASPVKRPPS